MRDRIKAILPGEGPGGSASGQLYMIWYGHRKLCIAGLVLLATAILMCLCVDIAHASFITDILGVNEAMEDLVDGALQPANDLMQNLLVENNLLLSFSEAFGPGQEGYRLISDIKSTVINPVGYSCLAIVFLIQTAKLAGKFDANGTMPVFKEVIFMFIYFVLFKYLLDISLDLCVGIFDWVRELIAQITANPAEFDFHFAGIATEGASLIIVLLQVLVIYLAAFIASAVGYFSVYARSLQIYLYTAFAPIPLSMLGLEETRQYGMGFIKNYLAVCLAGAIMALTVMIFPAVMSFATRAALPLIAQIGALVLFIAALLKSGSWARDILGG